ncbi:MAG: NAD(P)/FAD-dependent oxidoreductase [Devosia sp.]
MTGGVDCEVAISGGGPVALCLALLLARKGVHVRVFEAEAALGQDLRASTFHPPTLDMLDTLDLAAPLIAQGIICPHWQIRMHPTGERAVFDLSVLKDDTAHPYRLQCEQWKLSRLFYAGLMAEPTATVHFGHKAVALSQDDDHVGLTVETDDGRESLKARLVVGADGAKGFVRGAIGLALEGETFPENTLLATTTFPFEAHMEGLSNVTYCWKAEGNFALLKVPDRWRVSIYPDETRPLEAQLTDEALNAAMQEIVPNPSGYVVKEMRPYRIHQRIVPTYAKGRVALAGDAAHLNSPVGGMGLNGGLHDAFALSEAILDIVRGGAPLTRLDLYDRQRRPVAADQILAQAGRNRARMRTRDPQKRAEILADLQAVTADRVRLREYLLRSSMIEGLKMAREAA